MIDSKHDILSAVCGLWLCLFVRFCSRYGGYKDESYYDPEQNREVLARLDAQFF